MLSTICGFATNTEKFRIFQPYIGKKADLAKYTNSEHLTQQTGPLSEGSALLQLRQVNKE